VARPLLRTWTSLVSALLAFGLAQASNDIFIVPVDGKTVGTPLRVTDRAEYDNQPQFLPDGRSLIYTSMRGEATDIFRYDLESGEAVAVVSTPQSEYSPTPVPGRDAISVVRDYGDLKQQLWSFPLDGSEGRLLLPDVNPVGYHAWVSDDQVILFVLGEPHTLQLATIGPGAGKVVGDSPGRALARIPGRSEMSFVDKTGEQWWLTAIDPKTGTTRRLIAMHQEREDCAWSPDGSVWMGDGSELYRWHPDSEDGWELAADLGEHGIEGITRLAFSPDGTKLAVVGARP
jgi:Tol biopolymer transport system component